MIKNYMENRLRLFSFHLWSLVLCSRTAIVWTMMSFHYDNRILKPGFCLVLQVWAFLFSTSMRSTNLNMKQKQNRVCHHAIYWEMVKCFIESDLHDKSLMFCFHCFTADLTPWSRFSRKISFIILILSFFCFVFFPLNWSKANTINVIKPEKSGKEVIGVKITHKSGLYWWNHFLKQFRKCLYRHLAVKEKFLCQVHEFEVKTYWRSLGWTWPELTSHKSDSMAFAVTYCHFFEMLVTWAWNRSKFIRIGWCVVCTYQLLYDNVNYTCIFIGSQPRATIPSSVWFVINYKIFLMDSTKIKLF